MGYRIVRVPGHPLAHKQGLAFEHRVVLYDTIGPGPHPCHWCGRTVTWKPQRGGGDVLTVDHIDNDPQNNHVANLVPSCHRCNITRLRTDLVADDEPYITSQHRRGRVRAKELTCAECAQQFLAPIAEAPRRRFCSRPCMYAGRNKPR